MSGDHPDFTERFRQLGEEARAEKAALMSEAKPHLDALDAIVRKMRAMGLDCRVELRLHADAMPGDLLFKTSMGLRI